MYVPHEDFNRVLAVINTWRAAGAARLSLGSTLFRPPVTLTFVERHPQVLAFLDEHSMSMDDLGNSVTDVVDVLQAVVAGDESRFVQVRADAQRLEDGEVEDASLARAKYEAVAATFDVDDLRRKAWVKATSKSKIFTTIAWEVVTKHSDHDVVAPTGEGGAYGLLRITAEQASPTMFLEARTDVITMVVDEEDVDYLIDSLESLRQTLRTRAPEARGTDDL